MQPHRLRSSLCAAIVLAAAAMAAAVPVPAQGRREVPSTAAVGTMVANYAPLQPGIATGGEVRSDSLPTLRALGFATILDLRGPDERPDLEKAAAEAAGLRHVNIPITDAPPTDAQITAFGRMVEDSGTYPLLVHCASGNRVGALWTIYRARAGVPFATALAEGRHIGLAGGREKTVRQLLGELAR